MSLASRDPSSALKVEAFKIALYLVQNPGYYFFLSLAPGRTLVCPRGPQMSHDVLKNSFVLIKNPVPLHA